MKNHSYLLSPGPINIPDRVLMAMHHSSLHHRTPEFSCILKGLLKNMKEIFQTEEIVLPLHSTGRGALEATITNLFSSGDEIASICSGRFGEMYADIAEKFGLKVHRVCTDWEKDVDLEAVRSLLKKHPQIKALTVSHNETSTAVEHDIPSLAGLAHEFDTIIMVDTVSSLGGIEFRFDNWDVDVAIAASQKALMGPTGISFVVLNNRAWELYERSSLPKAYFDFSSIYKKVSAANPETPGSTPVTLVTAMEESTRMIIDEGLEIVWKRHCQTSASIKNALQEMGLELFPANIRTRSKTVTAFSVPETITSDSVKKIMEQLFGIVITGGLGPYKNKVIRLGHMGNFFTRDSLLLISSLEEALYLLGYSVGIGKGLTSLAESLRGDIL